MPTYFENKFFAIRAEVRAKIEEHELELKQAETFLITVRGSWGEQEARDECARLRGCLWALTELQENHGL